MPFRLVSTARGQILAIVLVVPLIILAIFFAAATIFQEENRGGRLVRDADRAQALLKLQIEEETAALRAQLDNLTDDSELARLMTSGEATAIERKVGPVFARLRERNSASHLYFIRPDRSSLWRFEANGKSGQVVDRLSLLEAAENGAASEGLDLSAFGVITLRVTTGWRDGNGKLIGFIEIGRDIAPLIDSVHRVMGLDILLLVKKDMLDREKWEEGERQSGAQGSWDELTHAVTVARTLPTIPTPIGLTLEDGQPPKTGEVTIVGVGRKSIAMSVRPLSDVEQKPIGDVVILRDVTATSRSMAQRMIFLVLFSLALIGLGFWRVRVLMTPPA